MESFTDFNNLSDMPEDEFESLLDDVSIALSPEDGLLFGELDVGDDVENDDDSIIEDSYDDRYEF